MNDLTLTRGSGGLGRREPSDDMVSGLIANGVAVVGGAQLSTVYRLQSPDDAKSILIDADYDADNDVLVWEHISEFFRINPSGTLYIMLVAQAVTFAAMLDKTEAGNAKKLLIEAEGKIRRLGAAYNPTVAVTDTAAALAAILKANELAEDEWIRHRSVHIIVEMKGVDGTAPDDLRAQNSENVTPVTGQAYSVANGDIAGADTYAAVGTLLGARSFANVNWSQMWVEQFNMYGGSLTVPSVGGVLMTSLTEGQIEALDDAGHNLFRTHEGTAGLYWNDSNTATAITSDYATTENNEVINKAARLIRSKILPRLGAPIKVDKDTGQIALPVLIDLETKALAALAPMEKREEISAADVYIDPSQNVLSTSEIVVKWEVTPTGTSRNISGTISFQNPAIA